MIFGNYLLLMSSIWNGGPISNATTFPPLAHSHDQHQIMKSRLFSRKPGNKSKRQCGVSSVSADVHDVARFVRKKLLINNIYDPGMRMVRGRMRMMVSMRIRMGRFVRTLSKATQQCWNCLGTVSPVWFHWANLWIVLFVSFSLSVFIIHINVLRSSSFWLYPTWALLVNDLSSELLAKIQTPVLNIWLEARGPKRAFQAMENNM